MSDHHHSRPPRRNPLIIWALLLALLVIGGMLLWYFGGGQRPSSVDARRQLRTVTLYFAAVNEAGLVAETREIADSPIEAETLQATVQALIDGPTGKLAPVLPRQTVVRGVTVAGSELQVDFSRDLVDAHPGGSWGELLTVQALANTVAISFPHLRQVRILIEGVAAETLKGHIDLRQPVSPDFTLVVKPPAGGTATTPTGKNQ